VNSLSTSGKLLQRSAILVALVLLAAASVAAPRVTTLVPDGRPHRFEARDRQFLLDGESTLIVAGEMHFGRVLPEDWELRIKQARAMGLNTLSFYLFWNLCEPREGEFVFTGMTDVRRMLQLCQQNGMWAILRPGPYCCAEVEYGGIPWWTAKYPDVKIRTNDPTYVAWSRRYIEAVARQVADLQVSRGGPLLMVQMENEYGMVARGNNEYLKSLRQIFLDAGFEVPLFTCDPFFTVERDFGINLPGVLRGRNGLRNDRDLEQTRAVIGNDPVFVPELYTAWFSGWGQPIATRNGSVEQAVEWTDYLLGKEVSFCYYMFFGGTTYGFLNGCNEYLPVQTSYDYHAPIDEAGRTTPKYRALRELLSSRLGLEPPPIPPEPAVTVVPTIPLSERAALLDLLPAAPTRVAPKPSTMEELGQACGFVLYRKRFADGLRGTLELRNARDYTIAMVNGRTVGRAFVGLGLDTNKIVLDEPGQATLDLLVYNLGRISVITSAHTQDRARKGLVGGATLDGNELLGWEMFALPLDSVGGFRATGAPHTGPTFYRGTFEVATSAATFLDLRPWSMGVVWVNGHNLGRFWDRGALRSLFLPAHWQKPGRNEIVVLELHDAPAVPEIGGADHLIEEQPVPFPVRLDRRVLQPSVPATTPSPAPQ
jgi:beta-galactosidase